MNVLCIGSGVVGGDLAAELVTAFLSGRVRRRRALPQKA